MLINSMQKLPKEDKIKNQTVTEEIFVETQADPTASSSGENDFLIEIMISNDRSKALEMDYGTESLGGMPGHCEIM